MWLLASRNGGRSVVATRQDLCKPTRYVALKVSQVDWNPKMYGIHCYSTYTIFRPVDRLDPGTVLCS